MFKNNTTYRVESDEQLAHAVAKGSEAAFNELYKRYGQKMYSYFFRMLWKNQVLAEDQTQELFLKLFRHAYTFSTNRSFATWLYSVAHNMCKNEYRKASTTMKYKPNVPEAIPAMVEKNSDLNTFKQALQYQLEQLPEEKKSLFVLRFEEQLSIPEISQIVNLPEGTVKSRIFYLMQELRIQLASFKHLTIYP